MRCADSRRTNQQNALAGDLPFHRRLEMNGEIANLVVGNRALAPAAENLIDGPLGERPYVRQLALDILKQRVTNINPKIKAVNERLYMNEQTIV